MFHLSTNTRILVNVETYMAQLYKLYKLYELYKLYKLYKLYELYKLRIMKVPEPAFPFFHTQEVHVRFNDFDMLGHVNNTMYLQYMDGGKVAYINHVLGSNFNFHREAMVIANINCDFYHVTLMDEPLKVLTRVDSIGEYSFILEQRVINSDTQEVKCVCRTVMVGFNIEENAKMAIPPLWRELISDFEHRDL